MACPNMTDPFSFRTLNIAQITVATAASGSVAMFGLVTNVINITIFYRQGLFSSSSIVNLTGLAVSDLANCIFVVIRGVAIIWVNLYTLDRFENTAFSFAFNFGARPMEITVQCTCWITAFMTIERVICVVFPFKVKSLFTPKRSLAVVLLIYVLTFILCIPINFQWIVKILKHPVYNYTYIGSIRSDFISQALIDSYIIVNPFVLRFTAIGIVAFCNIILFWKVKQSSNFRKGAATYRKDGTDKQTDSEDVQTQTKEVKLLKMITVVSVVFFLCYSSFVIFIILYWVVWTICVDVHDYHFRLAYEVSNFFQILNSSTNFIIFYNMSSRFKEDVHTLWKRLRCKT